MIFCYTSGMKYAHGITLVEIAIVILIAALLIGTITPVYLHIIETRRIDLAIDEITRMQKDLDRFGRRHARFPSDLNEAFGTPPADPWGNPYRYTNIRNSAAGSTSPRTDANLKPLNGDYDLFSDGPDKASLSPIGANESRDDIIRARNGNYVGTAAEYR